MFLPVRQWITITNEWCSNHGLIRQTQPLPKLGKGCVFLGENISLHWNSSLSKCMFLYINTPKQYLETLDRPIGHGFSFTDENVNLRNLHKKCIYFLYYKTKRY